MCSDIDITNQTRQGFEIEARTTPLFNFSLTGGYTYLYAKNSDTGERLQTNSGQTVPPHVVKLALNYDKADLGLRGTLTGNYVWWNMRRRLSRRRRRHDLGPAPELEDEAGFRPVAGAVLLGAQPVQRRCRQPTQRFYTNATRWFEGGVRVNF